MALVVAICPAGLLIPVGLLAGFHSITFRFTKGAMTTSLLLMIIVIARTEIRSADRMKDLRDLTAALKFEARDGR